MAGLAFVIPANFALAVPNNAGRILALERARSLGAGQLGQLLRSADERTVVRAALAIGRTKRAAGDPLLAAHVRDPRVAVRAMSVYGLGLIASGSDAPALLNALDDANGAVRVAALDALDRYEAAGRLGANESPAAARIVATLAHDGDAIVRARAATALISFAKSPAAGEAQAALETTVRGKDDPRVRWHAMWTLFRGYAARLSPRFLALAVRDPDEVVRIEAVRAIGRGGHASELPLLEPLRNDASWRVQEQAAESILQLHGHPLTADWKAIPSYVHLPALAADPLASLPAFPRTHASGKLAAPLTANVPAGLSLDPKSAEEMTGPVAGAHPRVRIVTSKGNVYVTLFPEWAPVTVANFLALANRGYYDGNYWFRIVPDFVVQTGDPNKNGNGDAGYTIGAEENPLEQDTGVISMGMDYAHNLPLRDSAGTQYYVTLSPQLHLDRDFTVFGRVTSGFNVLAHLVESDRVIRVERVADDRL